MAYEDRSHPLHCIYHSTWSPLVLVPVLYRYRLQQNIIITVLVQVPQYIIITYVAFLCRQHYARYLVLLQVLVHFLSSTRNLSRVLRVEYCAPASCISSTTGGAQNFGARHLLTASSKPGFCTVGSTFLSTSTSTKIDEQYIKPIVLGSIIVNDVYYNITIVLVPCSTYYKKNWCVNRNK